MHHYQLTSDEWKTLFKTFHFNTLRGNQRIFLNADITHHLLKDCPQLQKAADDYFRNNAQDIRNLIAAINDKSNNKDRSNDLELQDRLVNQYISVIKEINIYDNMNAFMSLIELNGYNDIYGYTKNNYSRQISLFKSMQRNGLDIKNFLCEYAQGNIKKANADFVEFFFKWDNIDENLALELLKSVQKSHFVKGKITTNFLDSNLFFLNQLPRNEKTFEYLVSFLYKNKTQSYYDKIEKESRKYPAQFKDKIQEIFESDTLAYKVVENHLSSFNIDPIHIMKRYAFTQTMFKGFMMSIEKPLSIFILKECPFAKQLKQEDKHNFTFVTSNLQDHTLLGQKLVIIGENMDALINAYNPQMPSIKNEILIAEAFDKISFHEKLHDTIQNKPKTKGKKI